MTVSQLRPQESVTLNTDVLEEMNVRLGYHKAETAICTAMEDIAVLLQYTGTLLRTGDRKNLAVTARQIESLSERIGMDRLARVATDVLRLCDRDDQAALGATTARLRRVGETSLIAIWDREDLSI